MVDFPNGQPGDPVVLPVEKVSRRGVACATAPFQPMVGSLAKGQIQKCETVNLDCVQWMVAGQNGALGKNARGAVGMATKPGSECAIIHLCNMVGDRVKGMLWK